jgi:hypothetical protein
LFSNLYSPIILDSVICCNKKIISLMWCLFSLVTCVPSIVDVKFFYYWLRCYLLCCFFFMINGNDIMVRRRTRNEYLKFICLDNFFLS